jgi:hypothetical protein
MVAALIELGVDSRRVVKVLNRAPCSLSDLAFPRLGVDDDPAEWAVPLTRTILGLLDECPPVSAFCSLVPVAPGSIGHWTET